MMTKAVQCVYLHVCLHECVCVCVCMSPTVMQEPGACTGTEDRQIIFVSPTTALLLAGAAEHHQRPGRVRQCFPLPRCGRLTAHACPLPGGLVHRVDALGNARLTLCTWNMPVDAPFNCSREARQCYENTYTYMDGGLLTPLGAVARAPEADCFGLPIPRCTRIMASGAIGSLDCPRDIVAGDARDATLKIPRPAAGDPPPHVPKRGREGEFWTYASPSPGRVAAHHRCLLANLWSYSSNFTGHPPHIRLVDFPYPVGKKTATLLPSDKKNPAGPRGMMTPLGLGGGEGMLYVCM